MAKARTLKGLFRLTGVKFRRISRTIKVAGVGSVGGAAGGFASGEPGHRIDSAREGAIAGAATLGVGHVVFRRIRGRIIPIRVRK